MVNKQIGRRIGAVWLAVAALVAATAWLSHSRQSFDVEIWPGPSEFLPTDSLKGLLDISAVVKVTDTPPPPDQDNKEWYGIIYDIQITNVSGKPVRGLVVDARLDEVMEPWILSHMLDFGTDMRPIDLVPGQKPYGLYVSRISGIPNPTMLNEKDRRRLRGAIQSPLWLKVTWDNQTHFVRLDPEQINYQGLDLIGK